MSAAPATKNAVILTCFAGPDQGKRLAIAESEVIIGKAAQCNILSDDPDVVDRHVVFRVKEGRALFTAGDSATVFVDGYQSKEGTIHPGQQIRIGRSMWQLTSAGSSIEGFSDLIDNLGGRISSVAGIEKVEGFDARAMFSEVFSKHSDEEIESYFSVGSATSTPDLLHVDTSWPKPWIFLRTFGLCAIVYLGFVFGWEQFHNGNLIPGLITIGSFAIPIAIMIFFFEVNVVRNVSLYQVLRLVLLGGIASLILSLFLYKLTNLSSWLGAVSAGVIEETGKAAALLLVANKTKYRWTLNGMLFGAAIGAGFSAFETAGYAFMNLWQHNYIPGMLREITNRGIWCIAADHTLWTAMVGAALWRVKGDQKFRFDMVKDVRFLRVLGLTMVMHMINNSPIANRFHWKDILLGFVAWVVILGLVQSGLKQVREEQARLRGEAK